MPPEDRSRAVPGRDPVAATLVAAPPTVAASLAVTAARQGVSHEAGDRAGQRHALHEEGDVEAHRPTLPWPEFPSLTVTSLRLPPATSP
jgi:hypothetical protein